MTNDGHAQPDTLEDLLRFYSDAGVDAAMLDTPVNHLADAAATPAVATQAPSAAAKPANPEPKIPPPAPSASKPAAMVPDENTVALAREMAAKAENLEALREALAAFDGCSLKFTAKNLVFADGDPKARLMFVGEAPGRDEDIEGLPFVGRSGRLLNRMIAAIGLAREETHIANVIPWRPPGNRTPTPLETEICRPFISRQIELVNPDVLVTLGGPSAKTLLNTTEGILRMRGKWREHSTPSGTKISTMPTLHPAYLLRNPAHKRLAWRDFLEIKAKLRETEA